MELSSTFAGSAAQWVQSEVRIMYSRLQHSELKKELKTKQLRSYLGS